MAFDEYIKHVKNLPAVSHPDVFGLHSNSNITRDYKETQNLFDSILLTLPRENTLDKKTNQHIILELTRDINKKIPNEFEIKAIQTKFPVIYEESLNIFLIQELTRYNSLIRVIKESVISLNKANDGTILMSTQLEELLKSILAGKIPELWMAKSYPTLKPLGAFISDLSARLNFFKKWVNEGRKFASFIKH